MRTSYAEIIESADFVLATRRLSAAFQASGVAAERIYPALSSTLPERWFNAAAPPLDIALAARECAARLPRTHLGGAIHAFAGNVFDAARQTIGMYGKLGETKGTYDLVAAAGELRAQGREFNLVFATQGEPAPGFAAAPLQPQAPQPALHRLPTSPRDLSCRRGRRGS
jgi:hypothetical protein